MFDFFGFPSSCVDSEQITRRLGAGLEQELRSANEQRRAAEDDAAQLRAAATRACDSALGAPSGETSLVSRLEGIPSRLRAVVSEGAYLGALSALSVVTSHYDGLDLTAIAEGFAPSRTEEEIDALEKEAAPAAQALGGLVQPDNVLQAQENEE